MAKSPTPVASASSPPWLMHLRRYLPILDWGLNYRSADLVGDLMAGTIVAIVLIPQGMAYAMLAGLPPQVGLYASMVPMVLYTLFGTSRALSVGPVAIDSLLVAVGLAPFAAAGTPEYLSLALLLALMVGLIEISMGVLRLGFVVNFLSYAVIVGFTNAAVLVIGASQFKHLLGVRLPQSEGFAGTVHNLIKAAPDTNGITLLVGLSSIAGLLFFSNVLPKLLKQRGVPAGWITPLSRSGPLVVVGGSILLVAVLGLHDRFGVAVVGDIPRGLPSLSAPPFSMAQAQALLPTAFVISFVAFMEAISVAKSLASKRRQRIDPNQELLGLGAANLGAAFTGGYPITGGVSRSVVNFTAGANTGLSALVTASLIALVVAFFTPLLYSLPLATLAAVIFVAVSKLLDFKSIQRLWRVARMDAVTAVITFWAVLLMDIQTGILVGLVASIAFYLWRTSRPHMAEVGRVGNTEHFRNIKRHEVQTYESVLAIRIDESLYFANTKYLEDYLIQAVANHPKAHALLLICAAINHIDGSALDTLETLIDGLREAGVTVYFSEIKGPVMDQLQRAGFIDRIGGLDRVFLSTHQAMETLGESAA
ncbi:MAG: solute carrier family 26 protein [Leptolyngbya sp.]|nr:solute carrier family 26 protein [Leptolyngbya sp.]